MNKPKPVGSIGWIDMASENHESLREFYEAVVGWKAVPISMGSYNDYAMAPPDGGEPVAGICKEAGSAATGLPPVWMIYIVVANLDTAVAKVVELGGEVHVPPRSAGGMGRYALIRDPSGAPSALFEEAPAV
jgi:uncharacterized protein